MKTIKAMLLGILLLVSGWASAMDGVFDRSVEVAKYLEIVKTGSRISVVTAAKEIYVSGIDDVQLAAAVSERLLNDYPGISSHERDDIQYASWLAKALASFGIDHHADTLQTIARNTRVSKLKSYCEQEAQMVAWHHAKNVVMASRQYHHEGDDPHDSRLLNLLMADAPSLKLLALDRINWEKRLKLRLTDAMATQLRSYIERNNGNGNPDETDVVAHMVKLLGASGNNSYRPLLERVADASIAPQVKRQARKALEMLAT